MKRLILIFFAVALMFTTVFIAGCKDNTTRISKILDNPDRYLDRDVEIAGIVSKSYGVDIIIAEVGAYQVDDGTGTIWVTTRTGTPREDSKVWVKGSVSKGVKIMGDTFGAIIREKERKTKD